MPKGTDIDTEYSSRRISLIAAIGKNRELGKSGQLLWHLPEDMRRFKELTMGHPVIMGRKTWESLPEKFRPLSNRTNIVVTRRADYKASGAVVVDSLEVARAAAARAPGSDEMFVIGGGELYAAALPYANRVYLTLVDDEADADTFFPPYEQEFRMISEENGAGVPPHRFYTLDRK
ncbi:dihydrofolate reductase [Candidatus Kaiserbacteria bacterium]|nr:dihydrofolate reductase [Candidatus Kaiserbacteria bacterium]